MQASSNERRSDWFVRALGVVLATAALHAGLSHLLLAVIAPAGRPGGEGTIALVNLAVTTSSLGLLAILYLRAQYSTPSHATTSITAALRVLPPVCSCMLAPILVPQTLTSGTDAIATLAPTIAAVWGSAFTLSIPLKRILHALAIRAPSPSLAGLLETSEPPSLSSTYTRIFSGAVFSTAVVVIGAWLPAAATTGPLDLANVLPVVAGLAAIAGLAALAGLSLSETPGEDLVALANRLDAIGYDGRAGRAPAMRMPIAGTDQVGELVADLEGLRRHLDEELALYEKALDKTRAADAIKSDFLNAVSHELRTPLGTIGGFAQLLLEGHPTPLTQAQAEDVRLIRAGGNQLLDLINDILDMSMIESGELRLSFSPVDPTDLIREVVDFHRPLVHDSGVSLVVDTPGDLPTIVCDRRRVGQILTNLVSNAIKFTESGSVTVRGAFDPATDRVVIRCIDTGTGIAPQDLDRIFEMYRQAGSGKRRKKGTGLGLSIARTIAEHHGGELTVESTFGVGSTFSLALPLAPPPRPARAELVERAAAPRARRPRRISGEHPR